MFECKNPIFCFAPHTLKNAFSSGTEIGREVGRKRQKEGYVGVLG